MAAAKVLQQSELLRVAGFDGKEATLNTRQRTGQALLARPIFRRICPEVAIFITGINKRKGLNLVSVLKDPSSSVRSP